MSYLDFSQKISARSEKTRNASRTGKKQQQKQLSILHVNRKQVLLFERTKSIYTWQVCTLSKAFNLHMLLESSSFQ